MPKVDEAKELILTKNYAENPETAKRAVEHVRPLWKEVRLHRAPLESRWLQFYNIWKTIFDVQYYNGRSQIYNPELRKMVEFAVRNLRRNLFPTDDFFTVEPTDEAADRDQAERIKRFAQWQMASRIKLKRYVTPFLRQLCLYGWSPIKVVWDERSKTVYTHEKRTQPIYRTVDNVITGVREKVQVGERPIIEMVQSRIKTAQHPTFLPIDVFSFYLYPWTCWDVQDAYCTMEEMSLDRGTLLQRQAAGTYDFSEKELPALASRRFGDGESWSKDVRMTSLGLPTTGVEQVSNWNAVEYWGPFDLEDNGNEVDCVITILGGERAIQIRQNPHYDQEPPYLVGKLDEVVGEFYSSGLIEPLQALQYALNDIANQTQDSVTYALNPIVKYDPGRVVNPNTLVMAPGALWALTDPESAIFDRPPDVSATGRMAIDQLKSEISDYPGFERTPTTGRRPATQVSAIQQERGISVLDWSENIEIQVMNPFLRKQFMLNQEFLDEEVTFKVLGQPADKMRPEDLVGDFHFQWLGANQTQSILARSQQMYQFFQMALQVPQGDTERVDFYYLLKRYWKEGIGLDGENRITKKIDVTRMMSPEQENMILIMGRMVPVQLMDNHEEHEASHEQLLQIPDLPDFVKATVTAHLKQHRQQKVERAYTMPSNRIPPDMTGDEAYQAQIQGQQLARGEQEAASQGMTGEGEE